MSNQDRIKSEIEQNRMVLTEIDTKIDLLIDQLKDETLSQDDKVALKEQLDDLQYQHIDISADIAMLQEMLDKEYYQEDDDKEEKYDPLEEVFTGGDY